MNTEVLTAVQISDTSERESDATTSNWKDMYKPKGCSSSQEERRIKLLESQKKHRERSFNAGRQLDFLDAESELDAEGEEMEVTTAPRGKKPRKYAHTLMHSEWMMEVPPDLAEKWYFVLCPTGKRCLVVAQLGSTKAYSASGKVLATFQSLLPGGSRSKDSGNAMRYAVLDCVWSYHSSTYYVLDVLAWGNQPLLDCDTEFRFAWLKSQLTDLPNIAKPSKQNRYKFVALPFQACTSAEMEEVMTGTPPFPEVLDGVLFYHREAQYVSGVCPLIVWLLPFMLPEVLGVTVADVHAAQKPLDYPGHLEYVEHFQSQDRRSRKEDYKKRKAASKSVMLDASMESSDGEEEIQG